MILDNADPRFYIISYFLNGQFLKWEEAVQQDPFDINDEIMIFVPQQGNSINATVVGKEDVSEDEYKVYLSA
ncbi:MAG: hypothetical protein VKJ02_03365 [Snowella sp.]|nr:hypothetical protein [Snowella sp.]